MKNAWVTKALATAVFAGGAILSASASAAIVNAFLVPGENTFQDTDAERIMRGGVAQVSGNFQVGDIIQTALLFDTVNGTQIPFLGAATLPPYQLTAYAELQIVSFQDPLDFTQPCAGNFCTLVFAPSGNLGANVFASIHENEGGFAGVATMAQAPDTAIAQVLDQTLVSTIGIGKADDFWVANSLLDIGAAAALLPGAPQVALGVFGLTFLSNPGALPFSPLGMTSPVNGNLYDLVGNASAYQRETGVNTGWLVSSNLSATFSVNVVPEPGTLALLGGALLAAGFWRRRPAA